MMGHMTFDKQEATRFLDDIERAQDAYRDYLLACFPPGYRCDVLVLPPHQIRPTPATLVDVHVGGVLGARGDHGAVIELRLDTALPNSRQRRRFKSPEDVLNVRPPARESGAVEETGQ